ncbi:regulating synaptic membrane exocytosis protein 2-like [Schistocerca piceifrons]|uniref:regulating synaptic membrane exocytosis protein 2-like n=1 Tax=Schistocerca piceifrons TaxID=274613 RepID=UPI001F5E6DCB|nr:regulating synaptic membrane exocytosis protein 2-like [Schistocerca piceifrons]
MADLPDLSHLTPEERRIIESVMMRQKQEEERENEIMRRKQDEVQVLEETIRARSEQQKKAGVELDATCHICLKTKFADGVGHMCNYCNIRCCARCGGKVTLRSNKPFGWAALGLQQRRLLGEEREGARRRLAMRLSAGSIAGLPPPPRAQRPPGSGLPAPLAGYFLPARSHLWSDTGNNE